MTKDPIDLRQKAYTEEKVTLAKSSLLVRKIHDDERCRGNCFEAYLSKH